MPFSPSPRRRLGVALGAAAALTLTLAVPVGATEAEPSPSATLPSEPTPEVSPTPEQSPTPEPAPRTASPRATTSPTPSPTATTPPAPPKPARQTVGIRTGVRLSLPTVKAASSSKKRTVFVLQRWNGKKWLSIRTRTSESNGQLSFRRDIPFGKLRVKAKAKKGWTEGVSQTVNTRTTWRAGYDKLGIKNASIAVTPLGGETLTVGDHRFDYAWSTIKVPIVAVADARRQGNPADKEAALRFSNNAAAQRVYASLGSGKRAALTRHLRKYGDKRTQVSALSSGLTKWHVTHQSKYAAGIACAPAARQTRVHMKNARPSHPFGLLSTKLRAATAQKIGYGGQEVRQLAIVKLRDGRTYGVSILGDGGFRPARDKVDRIARWVSTRLEHLPARRC